MKKLLFAVYLSVMVGLIVLNNIQSGGLNTYGDEFEIVVESKIRAPQGAKWIVSNDKKYMYGNHGKARYILQGLSYGDVLSIRANDQNLIVSLNYQGEQIYTVQDYEDGVEQSVSISNQIMIVVSIMFLLAMFYLVRKEKN